MPYLGPGVDNGYRSRFIYTATAGQTSFSGGDANGITLTYTDSEYLDVYQNGVLLVPGDDYAATTGTTVVLVQGASLNDKVEMIQYQAFGVADTVSRADGGAFGGNISTSGTLAVTGTSTLTGNTTVGGTLAVTGIATFTDDIIIGDGKTIGSASDVDAMTISSGGVVNFTQIPTVSSIQLTNAPAFEAQRSGNQTISDDSNTKVEFNSEIFDSDSKYDHSTNYRFTPTVAGKYFVYANVGISAEGDAQLQRIYVMLYKNGSQAKVSHFNFAGNNSRFATGSVSGILTLDSDDYVEAYVQCADSSGSAIIQPDNYSTFGAYKLIGIS